VEALVTHEAPDSGESRPDPVPPERPADVPSHAAKPRFAASRRTVLAGGGAMAAAAGTFALLEKLNIPQVQRAYAADATATKSDIQFDIGAFIPPAQTIDGIQVRFGPVYTMFATMVLGGLPNVFDQNRLENALNTIEAVYPWSPSGVFTHVAYGGPYWNALPFSLASAAIPHINDGSGRFVQAPAVAAPTDVVSGNGIVKDRFNVPVSLELNWVLFMIRSDNVNIVRDVARWLNGSNVLGGFIIASPTFSVGRTFTSFRLMFAQQGLPRQIADQNNFTFRSVVNPKSTMWMSFVDQQTAGSASSAARVTFLGSGLTDMTAGRYLDNGSEIHFAHDIQDLWQFYDVAEQFNSLGQPVFGDDASFEEKVQYMFHAPDIADATSADGLTGPAFLPNDFRGTGYAAQTAQGIGTNIDPDTGQHERRMGHLSTLQRSSRDSAGLPLHIRLDGPGFDTFDTSRSGVPSRFVGRNLPKLHFSVFVPHFLFFENMRRNAASLDLQNAFGVDPSENGLERFITATRRQNFLIPPRRHRSFPLVEFL
jgi:hypothetical protein